MNDALPDINPNYTQFTASFYLTQRNANTGDLSTAIPTPEQYLLNRSSRRVYVRLENTDGCYTTTTVDLRIVSVPQIIVAELEICDFLNDDIETTIDLSTFDATIRGTQFGVTVTYYRTAQDATDQANAITTTDITPTTTLYINLTTRTNCIQQSPITFSFIPTPEVNNQEIIVCDNETDGTEIYDLTQHLEDLVTDPTEKTILYFNTLEDATTNRLRITAPARYAINTAPQTVFVKAIDNTTQCYSIAELEITFTQPTPVTHQKLTQCDVGADGSEVFDVTTVLDDMIATPSNFEISYYTRRNAAAIADQTFEVIDPTNVDTTIASMIYIRFYDVTTGCYSIGEVTLELLKTPKLLRGVLAICDADLDGLYTLDLEDINTQMIQNTTDLVFTYYTSFTDANQAINGITTPDNYTVPATPHRIYARVEGLNNCFSVSFVDLNYKEKVAVLPITEALESCDNDLDGFTVFDLSIFEPKISTVSGVSFRYYTSQSDAQKEENEITTPTNYTNTIANTQQIFVRVIGTDVCDEITSFTIQTIQIKPDLKDVSFCDGDTVTLDAGTGYSSYLWNTGATTQTITVSDASTYSITLENSQGCRSTFDIVATKNPLPTAQQATLVVCDEDGTKDNTTTVDLTTTNTQLTAGIPGVRTLFYPSQQDLDADINAINATQFRNTENPQTLFVKVQNIETLCYSNTTLSLRVSAITPNAAVLEACDESDEDGIQPFDLTTADIQVLDGLDPTEVSYFETSEAATANQNPLPKQYTNTIAYDQVLYSRVVNPNGCVGIGTVRLIVRTLPDIELEEEVLYCQNTYPETITISSGIPRRFRTRYTYLWNTGATTHELHINTIGTYTLTLTDSRGCSKTKTFTVIPSDIATIDRIEIEDQKQINSITVFATGNSTYDYSIDGSSYQDSNFFEPITPGVYTIYVRDTEGCGVVTDKISVLGYPNFITPNGDGNHDLWKPIGFSPSIQEDLEIYIYDRYGKLLAKLLPDEPGWDGTLHGKPLPATDYWYRVHYREVFSGKTREFRGHFSLIR